MGGLHYLKFKIDPATAVWEELTPWQATYWKTLPHGYQVSFQCEEPPNLLWNWGDIPLRYRLVYKNIWYSAP